MSLANKMAGAARVAVDNARKTADQALHDRGELRRRVGNTVRDAPLTAVRYTMKGVGQALSLGGRMRQGLGDVRSSGVGGLMTRFRRGAPENTGTAPGTTETGRSAFEKAAGTETPADEAARPEGVRPARRARSARTGEAPATTAGDTDATAADTTAAASAEGAVTPEEPTAPATSAAESSANAVAAAGSPAATRTPSPGEADAEAPGAAKPSKTGAAKKTGGAEAKASGSKAKASGGIGGSGQAGTGGAGSELPVPEYDSRTVASLRARMRGLSLDDIRRLLEYEHNHAARPEVIGMFERRIAKLEAE